MGPSNAMSPIDDIAYLARSEHRAPTLLALTVRPRSRSELWEMTGVSSSTIRRTLSEFEERDWIRRNGYRYEATEQRVANGRQRSRTTNVLDRCFDGTTPAGDVTRVSR